MSRPRIFRRVGVQPDVTYFKPAGIRMTELGEVILTVDEFEAVRLKDFLCLNQEAAAKKMKISQSTFHRLILSARKNLADAIVNGKAIRIEGGNFTMVQPKRMKMRGPFGAGLGGNCTCPKCGHEEPHIRGQPCNQTKCSECSSLMIR